MFDEIKFVPFTHVVIAFGGNTNNPLNPNAGTFVLAQDLYEEGYDVHAFRESNSDLAYDEVVSAVQDRMVTQVAIIGYSQGGGATWVVANDLATNIITAVAYTAYIDAVRHTGWNPEDRRPPGTAFHVNYWQPHESGILNLHGAPTTVNGTADYEVDTSTTWWGATLDHYSIDNDPAVLIGVKSRLTNRITKP